MIHSPIGSRILSPRSKEIIINQRSNAIVINPINNQIPINLINNKLPINPINNRLPINPINNQILINKSQINNMLPQSNLIVHPIDRSIRASEVNMPNENINIGRKTVKIVYNKNTIRPY